MEVESDEEDDKQEKAEEPPSQLDQDTQVQDMDEGSDDEEEGQKVPPLPRDAHASTSAPNSRPSHCPQRL